MNATSPIDAAAAAAVSPAQPCPFAQAARSLHAASIALIAGAQAAEKLGAELMAANGQLLQDQLTATASLVALKSPQDLLELQQQFARRAWAAWVANANAVAAATQQVWKPISDAALQA